MTENVDPLTYQNPDHMVWQLPPTTSED